jgi:hypothetical protein
MPSTLRKILCRSRLSHDWRTVSSPDGERYLACSVCGRERPGGGSGTIGVMGGAGAG